VIEVDEVWQWYDDVLDNCWEDKNPYDEIDAKYKTFEEYSEAHAKCNIKTRLAYKPVEVETEKLPDIEFDSNVLNPDNYDNEGNPINHFKASSNKVVESVDLKEAAGKSWEYNSKTLGEPINPTAFVLGFGAGANWQKQQQGLMSLESVIRLLQESINIYKAQSEQETDELLKNVAYLCAMDLYNVVEDIKTLNKKP